MSADEGEKLQWQVDYQVEYWRTTGKSVKFEYHHGGWWMLTYDNSYTSTRRQSEVLEMTKVLKERPSLH
uniref:Uncharacterized protein n=1 Tax=viral metagenome TaxID=1070528 RepID=A0A6H1ZVU8_9ZZZZ